MDGMPPSQDWREHSLDLIPIFNEEVEIFRHEAISSSSQEEKELLFCLK